MATYESLPRNSAGHGKIRLERNSFFMRSIWTEFTLQLRMDIGSTETLDEIGPSRPGYLHKPIIFTSVKDFLKPVPNTLSRLQQCKNSTCKVITKNLPVGGFMVLRGCKKSLMK